MSRKLPNHAFAALDAARRESGADRAFSLDRRRLIEVEVARVRPNPHQPRTVFRDEDIDALAASIARVGLQEPILIRDVPGERDVWELVAGERRLRAHERLGRSHIEAILTDGDAREIALVENLQRVDLSPFELAAAIGALAQDNDYSHEDLAVICGRHRSEITRLIGLSRLPASLREDYDARGGDISVSVLYLLAETPDDALRQVLWDKAKAGATLRHLRAIRDAARAEGPEAEGPPPAAPATRAITRALRGFDRTLAQARPEDLTAAQREHLQRLHERISALLAAARIS
ncbi:ParB/RepB/Spo0J family partition protein [Pararhodospirillum oryzae]|uniref:ParB-like N-terminal domain-containing protein n=1 Tax=Pararhodospirillum oryzae TaxID=478448 RepID=A0A512H9R8_9PROT|nr:ParB/RepB/Spo0J family partition protein [Pararhodospirillum oryzae]GEO82182.1 hypothetical protein ROR02_23130 [Pararhodospirillum oryzae]